MKRKPFKPKPDRAAMHEHRVLRNAAGTGDSFDLLAFNKAWASMHGPLSNPSKSIQDRQAEQRRRQKGRKKHRA